MQRSARPWFIGALIGAFALALTSYLSHGVAYLRGVDVHMLQGFLQLRRPILDVPANVLASLFDPVPYVVLCAVPVAIALRRGRRELALAILVLLLGANASTELVKPLAAGPRDWVAVPGVYLSHATWPSGHSTASMSLALAVILSVPQRVRPAVASLMAALVVGVVYSLLTLGWHYPSDVLGGFEMSLTWALLVVGLVRLYEARRAGGTSHAATVPASLVSVTETLWPVVLLLVCALGTAAILTAARPARVFEYVSSHPAFTTGAAAIVVLSFACACGLSLLLRRPVPLSDSGPAPTAPRRPPRSLPG